MGTSNVRDRETAAEGWRSQNAKTGQKARERDQNRRWVLSKPPCMADPFEQRLASSNDEDAGVWSAKSCPRSRVVPILGLGRFTFDGPVLIV